MGWREEVIVQRAWTGNYAVRVGWGGKGREVRKLKKPGNVTPTKIQPPSAKMPDGERRHVRRTNSLTCCDWSVWNEEGKTEEEKIRNLNRTGEYDGKVEKQ